MFCVCRWCSTYFPTKSDICCLFDKFFPQFFDSSDTRVAAGPVTSQQFLCRDAGLRACRFSCRRLSAIWTSCAIIFAWSKNEITDSRTRAADSTTLRSGCWDDRELSLFDITFEFSFIVEVCISIVNFCTYTNVLNFCGWWGMELNEKLGYNSGLIWSIAWQWRKQNKNIKHNNN